MLDVSKQQIESRINQIRTGFTCGYSNNSRKDESSPFQDTRAGNRSPIELKK
jgi:hypothetical protein